VNSAASSELPLRIRLWRWLPDSVDKRVRVIAWVSLIAQIALIGTGGAVRLTASGLGCPTWPECSPGSIVTTPEMGFHGIIEFGNRLLTFVLAAVTIIAFLFVIRFRKARPDLFGFTLAQGLSIPFQAVLGGITVLTGLNPYVVGAHFAVSIVLVVVTALFVFRAYRGRAIALSMVPEWAIPGWYRALVWAAAALAAVTVTVGILTTGSGPHAGDNSNPAKPAPRNGLNPELLQHVHSWPAYALFAITVVLAVAAVRLRLRRVTRTVTALLAVELVQIVVGLSQARLGLPELLVGIHMVLAGLLVAAATALVAASRPDESAVRELGDSES
jgi:cytochrome c oxidase assembly protein subunit 15